MWSNIDQDVVDKAIKNLQTLSLLETAGEKIALNAFMIDFVQETIDDESKYNLVDKIAEFYALRLHDLYKINSAIDYDLKQFA